MTQSETVRKKNAKFGGMTKAEQRVAIARDALAWLKAGALIAQRSTYGYPVNRLRDPRNNGQARMDDQLRDVEMGPCRVCGLGALFLAKAVRFDDVTIRDWCSGSSGVYKKLGQHFSRTQIAMIEVAFEENPCFSDQLSSAVLGRALFFWATRGRPSDYKGRLIAILRNIIQNGGEFRP
jgi:hypothetical protein